MKIMSVVGARPNFMKVAPIIAAIRAHNSEESPSYSGRHSGDASRSIRHVLVHTGQHYGELMSDSFFTDLQLPKPDVHLGVGSGSHAAQTAEIMRKFEEVLLAERPDVLVVVGDVNSTLACALVTAKVSLDTQGSRPLIAHVESGLRSFDRTMPEEINRILTDHLADVLFVTEESGIRNLREEGIPAEKIHFVGNTMIDSLIAFQEKADLSTKLDEWGLRRKPASGIAQEVIPYALLTMHRPANVDNPAAFGEIMAGLAELAAECPVVFPVHPRTRKKIEEFQLPFHFAEQTSLGEGTPAPNGFLLTEPLGYLDFLCLMKHAAIVVTDSGGIQEETTCLRVPCVTIRENTERPVTLEKGTNLLAGTRKEGIARAVRIQRDRKPETSVPQHWDGHAAKRIVEVLCLVGQMNPVRV